MQVAIFIACVVFYCVDRVMSTIYSIYSIYSISFIKILFMV